MIKDWLAARVSTPVACEGSRLKTVGLYVLATYKIVVAWFPGPAENAGRYLLRLRRLNQGLDTRHWGVYEGREEPSGIRLVLNIDASCATVLERLVWRPVSGVGHAKFSLLGAKTEKNKIEDKEKKGRGKRKRSNGLR